MKHSSIIFTILFFLTFFSYGSELDSLEQEAIIVRIEKSKVEDSDFDKYFNYGKSLLTPLIAIISLWLTLPLLRNKLAENHITKALETIQRANSETKSYNQKLIDKYLPLTYENHFLSVKDIDAVLEDVKQGFYIAQNGSSDVNTLMYFLKSTIQGTCRHYDPKNHQFLVSTTLLGFVISTLELVNYYSTQVLQIPKSAQTINDSFINDKLKKIVTRSTIKKYKHFDVGIINDPHSAHYTMFIGQMFKFPEPLLMRAGFQIFMTPTAVSKFLYINNIYAPSELVWDEFPTVFGERTFTLYLVGFNASNQLTSGEAQPKRIVNLIYSNPDNFHKFISPNTFTKDKLCSNFYDSLKLNEPFDLKKSNKLMKVCIETISLQFDRKYLEDNFTSNKTIFKSTLNSKKSV